MAVLSSISLLLAAIASLASGYQVGLRPLSTVYLPYSFDGNDSGQQFHALDEDAVEKFDLDPATKIIYGVGTLDPGTDGVIHIVDASDPTNLRYLNHATLRQVNLNDVETCGGHVFVAYDNTSDVTQGGVMVLQSYSSQTGTMRSVHNIQLTASAQAISVTKDCREIVVPIDGPVSSLAGPFLDSPGSVAIVRFPQGLESTPDVTLLDYTKFDSQFDALSRTGVRWVYRGTKFSENVMGEAVTLSADESKAYVALQVNNAIAEVDLRNSDITAIHGLGFKQWGELDASDSDGGINIASWPLYAMYQPDDLTYVRWSGQDYVITANEGDIDDSYDFARGSAEAKRGHSFTDAEIDASVNSSLREALSDDTKLGRLYISAIDGLLPGSDNVHDKFYIYGGRGFSVFRASDMQRVYDSGSEIERRTAQLRPDLFNSDMDEMKTLADTVDLRSDNKGPETETLETGELGGRLLIFVGNEQPGTIFVYSVAHGGMQPQFETMISGIPRDSKRTWGQMYSDRDLFAVDPACIRFYGPGKLADYPVLVVVGAVSGTITTLRVEVTDDEVVPIG